MFVLDTRDGGIWPYLWHLRQGRIGYVVTVLQLRLILIGAHMDAFLRGHRRKRRDCRPL